MDCMFTLFFAESFENLKVQTKAGTFPLNNVATVIQKSPSLIIIDLQRSPQVGNIIQYFDKFDVICEKMPYAVANMLLLMCHISLSNAFWG